MNVPPRGRAQPHAAGLVDVRCRLSPVRIRHRAICASTPGVRVGLAGSTTAAANARAYAPAATSTAERPSGESSPVSVAAARMAETTWLV